MRHAFVDILDKTMCSRCGNEVKHVDEVCPAVSDGKIYQKPSEHGRILGAEFARMADELAPLLPGIPERCKTCAFREGTIPNQSAGTLSEALNCIAFPESGNFWCHHTLDRDGNPQAMCSGFLLARLAPFEVLRDALARALEGLTQLVPHDE